MKDIREPLPGTRVYNKVQRTFLIKKITVSCTTFYATSFLDENRFHGPIPNTLIAKCPLQLLQISPEHIHNPRTTSHARAVLAPPNRGKGWRVLGRTLADQTILAIASRKSWYVGHHALPHIGHNRSSFCVELQSWCKFLDYFRRNLPMNAINMIHKLKRVE